MVPLDKTNREPRRVAVATIALVLALIAAGCASESSLDASAGPLPEAQADDATAATGQLLLPTADGGQIDWNSLAGQDVLLWFWAPW